MQAAKHRLPLFYVMLNLHIIPVLPFAKTTWRTASSLRIRFNFGHFLNMALALELAEAEALPATKQNQWLLHIYWVEVLFVRFDPFSMSLDVRMCAMLTWALFIVQHCINTITTIRMWRIVFAYASCHASMKIKCFIKSGTMYTVRVLHKLTVQTTIVDFSAILSFTLSEDESNDEICSSPQIKCYGVAATCCALNVCFVHAI